MILLRGANMLCLVQLNITIACNGKPHIYYQNYHNPVTNWVTFKVPRSNNQSTFKNIYPWRIDIKNKKVLGVGGLNP